MFAKIVLLTMMVGAIAAVGVNVTTNPTAAQLSDNDVLVLKYAATLENLEATFYNHFLSVYGPTAFSNYDPSVYTALQTIQQHENAHATFLNQTLATIGASQVPVCTYNFSSVTSVGAFISTAMTFENVGVSAYDGAINMISNPAYVEIAATIATIEARHASFLGALAAGLPIPTNAQDATNAPLTVAGIIAPFLVNCSYNVINSLPILYKVVPVTTTVVSNPTSAQLVYNDIAALNYALFLEQFESAFFTAGQAAFGVVNFTNAGYNASVYSNLALINAHETAHVNALTSAVTGFGGNATAPCSYNFASIFAGGVSNYLYYAQVFENYLVAAYDTTLNTIYDSNTKMMAATIATVEARHAAFFNRLVLNTTGPAFVSTNSSGSPFDATTPFNTIRSLVLTSGLASCPNLNLVTPVVLRLTSVNNATTTAGATTRAVSLTSTGSSSTGNASPTTNSASSVAVGFFAVATVFALLF